MAGPYLPPSLSPLSIQGGAHLITTLGRAPQGTWGMHGVACPMLPMALGAFSGRVRDWKWFGSVGFHKFHVDYPAVLFD